MVCGFASYGQSTSIKALNQDQQWILVNSILNEETAKQPVGQIKIVNSHFNPQNGVTYVYFQQVYKSIEVYKAIGNLAYQDQNRFIKKSRLLTTEESFLNQKSFIAPYQAVEQVRKHLGLPLLKSSSLIDQLTKDTYVVSQMNDVEGETELKKVWAKNQDGFYVQSWRVCINPAASSDHWEIIIDGTDGTVLSESNSTLYCSFDNDEHECNEDEKRPQKPYVSKHQIEKSFERQNLISSVQDGSQYNVYAQPLGSPSDGDRTVVIEPADVNASPFGWHDINGVAGPEFDILRGNNVHAYQDIAANNEAPDIQTVGQDLKFDFPIVDTSDPEDNIDADVTNLFYWSNYLHDWSYTFGFTEAAGNFQTNNYGKGGEQDDHVLAETLDGSDTNNAVFSAPRDGASGSMEMFKWNIGEQFEVLSPANLSGSYETGSANFGPSLQQPISGTLVYAEDNGGDIRDVCDPIINASSLAGNIAIIDRGICDFSFKVHAAQKAGAIGCIICNNLNDAPLVTMSAGDSSSLVNIPSLFFSKEDCQLLKDALGQGVVGRFNASKQVSSSFDNGIVAHEYGHGITMRLSGGASTSACLDNDEQMGEGWSDFFALVLTQQGNDSGSQSRGIGTFVLSEPRDGRGIRRYPYSTDMNVNPQLHSHIRFSVRPHDVGEIWSAVLWDMYWAFLEQDGYDATWKDPTSGNFRALQIVMDGLKLQECDPSLIEARDAILDADRLNNFGENQCLIWRVFARRGLGVDASSNDGDTRRDNVDGFEVPLSCSGELSIQKEMTPFFNPGDDITVQLKVSNYKESLTDLTIIDDIPAGTSFKSADAPVLVELGGDKLTFNIGSIELGEELIINYVLGTEGIPYSSFNVYDDLDGELGFENTTTNDALAGWALLTGSDGSGSMSLRVFQDTLGGESFAQRRESFVVSPANRLLKFNHHYDTDLGIDGGRVEISFDGGITWSPIDEDKYIVNGLPDQISNCFNNCPAPDFFYRNVTGAFTGEGDQQTTIIDLEEYLGQSVKIRFNYISLLFRDRLGGTAWSIDDFELFERREVSGQACIVNDSGTLACAEDFSLINSNALIDPVTQIETDGFSLSVHPNPADQFVFLQIENKQKLTGTMRVVGVDGRVALQRSIELNSGTHKWQEDVAAFLPGLYLIEISDHEQRYTVAFIKQ